MGIQVEFNPDLALRNYSCFKRGERLEEECIPEKLEAGKTFEFLKKGLRNYWLLGEIPLVETGGDQKLSKPIASVVVLEVTHFLKDGEPYTQGKYLVKEVFDPKDARVHFDGFNKI
ncbi:MAG: hypothetical protein HZB67_01665 [Candidatus Aenigmarchaeota archaeon]|nr:hypothetical protein [Candidatus Aenigmarchaeota archaeon]MBI5228577.1 hypothetical protein [Candidatus Micrarchaeota archaeon]